MTTDAPYFYLSKSLARLLPKNVRDSSFVDSSLTFSVFLSTDCRHAVVVQYQGDSAGV